MRRIAPAIAAVALLAGCGGGGKKATTTATAPQPAKTAPAKTAPAKTAPQPSNAPKYFPSTPHKHHPPGYVYNDEIGENVLTAPYDRIIELFGQPASRHGKCIRYRIVHDPKEQWEFCFKGQTMDSAMIVSG